ncbi:hypothetical protein C408_1911 [Vibrio diabolicus E0666]|nr:hypothetical protein C408_1911 [Vibrio diabolicus E0666]
MLLAIPKENNPFICIEEALDEHAPPCFKEAVLKKFKLSSSLD